MANVLNEEKKQQILALGRLGWSLRRIQQATRVRRETISGYLKAAGITVWRPGGWSRQGQAKPAMQVITDPAKPAIEVTTGFGVELSGGEGAKPCSSLSACESVQEVIQLGLSRGRNARAIWQDLVSDHGFSAGYQSVRRFIYKLRGAQTPQARAVILTVAGEEAQVDYGSGPMVRDPQSGKYRRTRLFVMTLGYSRKSVRLLTFRSSSRLWAELHEKAFRRLGGSTRIIVLDHYGTVALPCRIQDPDGKVESAVGHAQKMPLQGKRFESLEEAQANLDRWEAHWADTRIHGTTKRQVAAMFAEEKPALLPLLLE